MLQITKQQAKAINIASSDDSRPVLTAVEVRSAGTEADKRLSVTATDTYCLLNIKSRPAEGAESPPEPRLVGPAELKRAIGVAKLDKADMVDLPEPEVPEIEGNFPDWQKLVQLDRPHMAPTVNRRFLIKLLEQIDSATVTLNVSIGDDEHRSPNLDAIYVSAAGDDGQEYFGLVCPLRS